MNTFKTLCRRAFNVFDSLCRILIESSKIGFGTLIVGFLLTLTLTNDLNASVSVALTAGRAGMTAALVFTTLLEVYTYYVEAKLNRKLNKLLEENTKNVKNSETK